MNSMILFLIACAPTEREGTIVGNPSQTRPSLAEINTKDNGDSGNTSYEIPEFWYTGTEGVLVEIELIDVEGQSHTERYNQHMTLLGEDVFELPPGQWSAMTATFEDIYISGYFFEDNPHLIIVDSFQVELYSSEFSTDAIEINFEIGDAGWLDSYENWSTGDDIVISSTENFDAFNNLSRQSALFQDLDGDRLVSLEERENSLLAAGPDRALGDVDFMKSPDSVNISTESGCQSVALSEQRSSVWLLSFGLVGLMALRRRLNEADNGR